MPFKLAHPVRLSPPTLFTTPEAAYDEGKTFWPGETFYVEQVRPAVLSDFFELSQLLSGLRERMVARCGDDSPMDARVAVEGLAPHEGPRVFDSPLLAEAISETLDAFVEHSHLDLSGLVIVEARRECRPVDAQ